jgi:hypothetical protein
MKNDEDDITQNSMELHPVTKFYGITGCEYIILYWHIILSLDVMAFNLIQVGL